MSRKTNPTHSEVDSNGLEEATNLVGQIKAIVGETPALSTKDRARSAKLRKGGEMVIPTVATLSDQFGLTVASHPTTTMVEKAKRAQSLIPLHKQLVTATKQVADQMFSANSESWAAATVHYTMLRRLAKTNGDLETALAPVEQFFAHRTAEVIAEAKAKKDARKAAKAAIAAAKAAAKAAPTTNTTPAAQASTSTPVTVSPAVTPAPSVPATPATPVSSNPAPTV